jgi:hypothetical protein
MASAERVWKELGGTAQGWNDWAAESSLAGFYGGAGGSQAWSKLAESSPDLVFTDALGNRWNSRDLAKKTTFVSMWSVVISSSESKRHAERNRTQIELPTGAWLRAGS